MILIVGGAGYIGSHVNKELNRRGYETVIYDNLIYGHREAVKWGVFEYGDLRDTTRLEEVFNKYDIEAVFHFAAFAYVGESVTNPSKYYNNNVSATINLLDAMVRHKIPYFVFSSTCATYGEPERVPITEDMPQNPINPYGASKLMVERILEDYESAYGLHSCCLRYFNAAGDDLEGEIGENHNPETHIIPLVLDAAIGKRDCIKVFGTDYDTEDGSCIRDYIHVLDLADAHIRALDYMKREQKSNRFNLGTSNGTSVLEIIDAAKRITGRDFKVVYDERRPGDPARLIGGNEKAREVLGWVPKYSDIDTILSSAWTWHQKLNETQNVVEVAKKKKKILILDGGDICYGVLSYFDHILKESLIRLGYEVEICPRNITMYDYKGKIDAIISYNTIANGVDNTGNYVMDEMGVPFVNYIVDHPRIHHHQLKTPLKNYYAVCLDDNHVDYIKWCYPHIKNNIRGYLMPKEIMPVIPYQERKYEVVFLGSYTNEKVALLGIAELPEELGDLCYDVINEILDCPQLTIESVLKKAFKVEQLGISGIEFADIAEPLIKFIEIFLRNYYRHVLIQQLAEAGVHVSIVGNGWDELDVANHPCVHILPSVGYAESIDMIANTKILLNVMPWFKAGMHDRVLAALINHTVLVTDGSDVIDRDLVDGEDCIIYRLDAIQEVAARIQHLLDCPQDAEKMAEAGYQKASAIYSADEVTRKILEMLGI